MKFHHVVENALNNTQLKRVRMKTDPRDHQSPSDSLPYEGYIIEENEGMLRVMVMAPDMDQNTIELSPDQVEPHGGTFEMFKQFVMNYLSDVKRDDCDEASHYNIINAGDIQHLEAFLKERGVEREEFEKISKLFLMS